MRPPVDQDYGPEEEEYSWHRNTTFRLNKHYIFGSIPSAPMYYENPTTTPRQGLKEVCVEVSAYDWATDKLLFRHNHFMQAYLHDSDVEHRLKVIINSAADIFKKHHAINMYADVALTKVHRACGVQILYHQCLSPSDTIIWHSDLDTPIIRKMDISERDYNHYILPFYGEAARETLRDSDSEPESEEAHR